MPSHLDRKAPPVDAVFWARRAIAVSPVKFHLLGFESARQASTTYKIVVLQKDGNCKNMEGKGNKVNLKKKKKKKTWMTSSTASSKVQIIWCELFPHVPVGKTSQKH